MSTYRIVRRIKGSGVSWGIMAIGPDRSPVVIQEFWSLADAEQSLKVLHEIDHLRCSLKLR